MSNVNINSGSNFGIVIISRNDGKVYNIDVQSDNTVEEVKLKLQDKEGIPVERQLFSIKSYLDDRHTLSYYNVQSGSTVHLHLWLHGEMLVFVKSLTGKMITIECESTTTIQNFKVMIREKEGILEDHQRLVFAGKGLDDDDATLRDYNVRIKSTIYLVVKPRRPMVFVETLSGKSFKIPYKSNVSIGNIKNVIHNKGGIPEDQQRLFYKGSQLEDKRTLSFYDIENESTILLRLPHDEAYREPTSCTFL